MKISNVLIIFLCAVFSPICLGGTWTGDGKITGIYLDIRDSSEKILFRHEQARSGDNCSNNGNYYELGTSTEYSKNAISYLYSLEARSAKVRMYVDGCSQYGFPLVQVLDSINVSQ